MVKTPTCCSGSAVIAWIKKRKEMFYLTKHTTHCIYSYMVLDICLKTTQLMSQNPLPLLYQLILPVSNKGSFTCTIRTNRTAHIWVLMHHLWSTGRNNNVSIKKEDEISWRYELMLYH